MAARKPAFAVVRTKQITLPVLRIKKNEERFVEIKTPMTLGKKIDDKKDPATIMQAVDLETGELGIVVCSTILRKELAANYPDDSYVGRCFAILLTVLPGKEYNGVTLSEIEKPASVPTFDPAAAAVQRAAEVAAGVDDGAADEVEPTAEEIAAASATVANAAPLGTAVRQVSGKRR